MLQTFFFMLPPRLVRVLCFIVYVYRAWCGKYGSWKLASRLVVNCFINFVHIIYYQPCTRAKRMRSTRGFAMIRNNDFSMASFPSFHTFFNERVQLRVNIHIVTVKFHCFAVHNYNFLWFNIFFHGKSQRELIQMQRVWWMYAVMTNIS